MELQAVTASAATGLTRITIAMFMLGMYLTARRDPCTGYWSIATVLMAVGSLAPLYVAPFGLFGIWFASCMVIAGGVCWWWGLRLFFGRPAGAVGWWIIILFAVIVGVMFSITWAQEPRLIAFGAAVTLGAVLVIHEAWRGDGSPLTVSRGIVVVAYIGTLLSIASRSVYFLVTDQPVTPLSDHPANVILLYLLPMMCVTLASVGSLLMYFERTIAEKEHLAAHDDLTRMFNRRALGVAGRNAVSDSQAGIVSVLLIDIDHFKAVNDTLGHKAGDEVLCRIAETLAVHCRRTDVIGRHGGEEFCIVCPETGLAEAQVLSDRLLEAVASLPRPDGINWPLSISIGIAVNAEGIGWDGMLDSADKALYAAKAAGRGQAISA